MQSELWQETTCSCYAPLLLASAQPCRACKESYSTLPEEIVAVKSYISMCFATQICIVYPFLPRAAYARAGLSNWFCPSVVCLSSEKNCNLKIYRVKRLLILTITLKKKKICACIPDRDQSGSILRISSFFLFNIDIVRHFNTVNNSDTAEAGHTRALDTCSCTVYVEKCLCH